MSGKRHVILTIILIPLLVLSLTGLKLHFHYCPSESKLYTHFHVVTADNIHHSCYQKPVTAGSCCSSEDHSGDKIIALDHECCLDIISEVKTDASYTDKKSNNVTNQAQISDVMFSLPLAVSFCTVYHHLITEYIHPPDLLSSVIIRC